MKRYDLRCDVCGNVNHERSEDDDGYWVPAEVAQALYDALKYVCEGQGAQDFTTLYPEEFDMIRKAISLADGGE